MSKSLKIILFTVGVFVGLVVLVALTLLLFVDANAYKPRIETAASKALGMEVKVGGRLGIGFFPGLLVTLQDVRLRNRGVDVVSAPGARLRIDILALFQQEIRIGEIALMHPRISVERDRDGLFNFEKAQAAEEALPALVLEKISISGGTFLYADKQSGEGFEAGDCNLDVHRLRFARRKGRDITKNLSFTAELACGEIRKNDITVTDLRFSANSKDGIFIFKPVSMRVFGGYGSGSIRVDLAGAVPVYHVVFSISQFHIEEFLKTLSPDKVAEGLMDFSMNLSTQGRTANEMKQTAEGVLSLRGENLTLDGSDIDKTVSRFESSQNFNLVDVGAFFFAGPAGLAVTKGYNFASIFQGSRGRSKVQVFVSDWRVERGVAQAQDVAMATNKNRIALQGGVDFVSQRFNHVIMAVIDAKGCATVRQKIRGSFQKPVVEKPNILKSLSGPAVKLLKKGRDLFPGGECEVFYAGSVAPP